MPQSALANVVSHWKQAGGDIESLAQILGHASISTTVDLHGTLSIDDVQANYDRLTPDPL